MMPLIRLRSKFRYVSSTLPRHYFLQIMMRLFKASWWIWRCLWPSISAYLVRRARQVGKIAPGEHRFELAIILVSPTFMKNEVRMDRGPDLENELVHWLESDLGIQNIQFVNSFASLRERPRNAIACISYDWLVNSHRLWPLDAVRRAYDEARVARRLGLSVWPTLPDTYIFAHSLLASIFVATCGGVIPLQQSSAAEGKTFGLPNVVSPQFWTWNSIVLKGWSPPFDWESRENLALVALSGDDRRQGWFKPAERECKRVGISVAWSNGALEWTEYMRLVRRSKIIVTSNIVQDWFLLGPPIYRARVSKETVTNRTWEAFAAGSLLVCNDTAYLNELGFHEGEHFIPWTVNESGTAQFVLPKDEEMRRIAAAGHLRFLEVTSDSVSRD